MFIKNTSLLLNFAILLVFNTTNVVRGTCEDRDFYNNISHTKLDEIRKEKLNSSRILIELINLCGYALRDLVSLNPFHIYKNHHKSSNINGDRIISFGSGDGIGVLSLSLFLNRTTPLWSDKEKQKAIR